MNEEKKPAPQYDNRNQNNSKTLLGVLICLIPGAIFWGWILGMVFPKHSYERKTFFKGYRRFLLGLFLFFAIGGIISAILSSTQK